MDRYHHRKLNRNRDGVQKVVEGVLARLGGLDILVNNVGGSSAPSGGALALSNDD
jgi:NAD(P)-dependent dehydrogenase (short-subunit alcohol dehydrogenase family)